MWPFGEKAGKVARELSGAEKAEQRSPGEWLERLEKARLALLAAEHAVATAGAPNFSSHNEVIADLWRRKVEWRRREYDLLLTHALRCGVLDGERLDEVTGELPVSALVWL